MKILKFTDSAEITDIDSGFDKDVYIKEKHILKTLTFNFDIRVDIFALKSPDSLIFLYLFEEKVFSSGILKEITDCIDDAVVIVDGNGRLEYANPVVLRGSENIIDSNSFDVDSYIGMDFQKTLNDYGIRYESLIP